MTVSSVVTLALEGESRLLGWLYATKTFTEQYLCRSVKHQHIFTSFQMCFGHSC